MVKMIDLVQLGYSYFPLLLVLLAFGGLFKNEYVLMFGLALSTFITEKSLIGTLNPLDVAFLTGIGFMLSFIGLILYHAIQEQKTQALRGYRWT